MEKYIILSPIGEGSFAKVYRGREKFTGRVRRASIGALGRVNWTGLFRMWH